METLPGFITGLLAILLFSAFVKILATLSILRYGLGLQSSGFGPVVFAISLALSMLVTGPQLDPLGGMEAVLRGQIPQDRSILERTFRPFMEKNADPQLVRELKELSQKLQAASPATAAASAPVELVKGGNPHPVAESARLSVLLPAFMLSELRDAFEIGFMILIPFLVLDLLLANVLLALGAFQLPLQLVSLPLKILLFYSVDGWRLVSEKIIGTYF